MSRKNLFSAVKANGQEFSNAIVMAPMTRSRAIGSLPNELIVDYYRQRATAGLIVTEGTAPSPNGLGYARTPGLYTTDQIEEWKKVTEAVHKKGGKIFLQLMHVGRVAHTANIPRGGRILAPSAVTANGDMWTDELGLQKKSPPQEMTASDIKTTIEEFARASRNAMEAGFDGVELHGANGYLLEQFLNPFTNLRTDNYGGSIENRVRFVVEVVNAVADTIGQSKTGLRISPYNNFNDMPSYKETYDTYAYLLKEMSKLNIIYLHLIDYACRASEEGLNLIRNARHTFPNLLILNGGYTKERAERAIENDEADLISFGSPFIANPDLVFRFKNNISLTVPDQSTFYTPGEQGYTDYAFAETSLRL